MTPSPYTRFFFAHLVPGASLVCTILFLVDVPVEDGYRISLLEWSLESDRVFPYLVAIGLVASAVLGTLTQAARTLLIDRWVPARRAPEVAAGGPASAPAGPAPEPGPQSVADAMPTVEGAPAVASAACSPAGRRAPLGPLTELHGNLAIALFLAVLWITAKILRGGGTEVFPRRIAYGVPLVGLAACALLFACYRRKAREGA